MVDRAIQSYSCCPWIQLGETQICLHIPDQYGLISEHNGLADVQVMPFVMRRSRGALQRELPPEVIQDTYLEPSALQSSLYCALKSGPALQQLARAIYAGSQANVDTVTILPQVYLQQIGYQVGGRAQHSECIWDPVKNPKRRHQLSFRLCSTQEDSHFGLAYSLMSE